MADPLEESAFYAFYYNQSVYYDTRQNKNQYSMPDIVLILQWALPGKTIAWFICVLERTACRL